MGNSKTDMQFMYDLYEKRKQFKKIVDFAKSGKINEIIEECETEIEIIDAALQLPDKNE